VFAHAGWATRWGLPVLSSLIMLQAVCNVLRCNLKYGEVKEFDESGYPVFFFASFKSNIAITGPPTHSVGGQTSNGRWRLSASVTHAYAT